MQQDSRHLLIGSIGVAAILIIAVATATLFTFAPHHSPSNSSGRQSITVIETASTTAIVTTGSGTATAIPQTDPTATATSSAGSAAANCPGSNDPDAAKTLTIDNIPIPSPSTAIVTFGNHGGSNVGQYSDSFNLFNVCVPHTTPDQINRFYQTPTGVWGVSSPTDGWAPSTTFPYSADPTAPPTTCASMCWKQTVDAYTTEYVALESVALSGDNSVYVLHYVSLHKN